jgi:hypothetical protein
MKNQNMKKVIYGCMLALILAAGLVFAKRAASKLEAPKTKPRPLTAAEIRANWEATPGGRQFKLWEASPAGRKVDAAAAKISSAVRNYTDMDAVVSSLSLPAGSRLGFGLMISINGEDYILNFGAEESGKNYANFKNNFRELHSLKVGDKLKIRSHFISKAPKYAYAMVQGDLIVKDGKVIYKRAPRKGAC